MRPEDVPENDLVVSGHQTQALQVNHHGLLGEHAEYDLLTPEGRNRGRPHIGFQPSQVGFKPPILRGAPLVDPHAGLNLDP